MLFIRHGPKAYSNNKHQALGLDPPLTEAGEISARQRFEYLLDHYTAPKQLFCSPYLRARQTAIIAQQIIHERTGLDVPILYDPLLGEYLGNQRGCNMELCLSPETMGHNPIPPETFKSYAKRTRKLWKTCTKSGWYITHGIVIESIGHITGQSAGYPEPLEGIYVENGVVSLLEREES